MKIYLIAFTIFNLSILNLFSQNFLFEKDKLTFIYHSEDTLTKALGCFDETKKNKVRVIDTLYYTNYKGKSDTVAYLERYRCPGKKCPWISEAFPGQVKFRNDSLFLYPYRYVNKKNRYYWDNGGERIYGDGFQYWISKNSKVGETRSLVNDGEWESMQVYGVADSVRLTVEAIENVEYCGEVKYTNCKKLRIDRYRTVNGLNLKQTKRYYWFLPGTGVVKYYNYAYGATMVLMKKTEWK